VNVFQIVSNAALAAEALSNAGVAIPSPLLNVIASAPPVISAIEQTVKATPLSVPQVVADFAALAASLPGGTGITQADSAIESILKDAANITSAISNLESGQALALGRALLKVGGRELDVHVVAVVAGGTVAQQLGL